MKKVKLFYGLIHASQVEIDTHKTLLENIHGKIDYSSPAYPFNVTNYYEKEMGTDLSRSFFSFEKLIEPEEIIAIKQKSKSYENQFLTDGKRSVNLDPGYLDFYKIVLPSFKEGGHKLYIKDGIYLDIVLLYDKGWKPFIWTFPDFSSGRYDTDFDKIRTFYKKQINSQS
ncbi:MAG: DUF4416 family protein [Planctomycetes bacterium]|nr:DUF4416 family protein [Planctomycetota bacterium]